MANAPNVRYIFTARAFQEILEINFMNHTLDIRHTDLEGMVNVFAAINNVNSFRKSLGNQSFTVMAKNSNIPQFFLTIILFNRFTDSGSIYRNNF